MSRCIFLSLDSLVSGPHCVAAESAHLPMVHELYRRSAFAAVIIAIFPVVNREHGVIQLERPRNIDLMLIDWAVGLAKRIDDLMIRSIDIALEG